MIISIIEETFRMLTLTTIIAIIISELYATKRPNSSVSTVTMLLAGPFRNVHPLYAVGTRILPLITI